MSVTLAFFAAFFASLTTILAKLGMEKVNSNLATAIRTIVVLVMSFLIVLSTGQLYTITTFSQSALLFIFLSGISTGLSWLFFFRALSIGDVSKVVPLDKTSVILTILLSFLILGEKADPIIIIGVILIMIGTMILIGKNKQDKPFKGSHTYIIYAILAAIFAALTAILAKIGMEGVDSNVATLLRTIVILIFAWGIVCYQGKIKDLKRISNKDYLFLSLSGVATGLSWLCYFKALAIGRVSVVAPIDKFSIVFTMLLSFILLKEKLSKQTVLGGIVITIGTLVLIY